MRLTLTALAVSVTLVACGGGGDGGDDTPLNPGAGTATALTSANYVAVAQEALSASAFLLDAGSFVLGAQVTDPGVLVRFGQAQLLKLPGRTASGPVAAVGATQTYTEPCNGGGSLTVVENDANGNQEVDPGDSLTLTANNCAFEGQVLNGQLSVTLSAVTGLPGETASWSVAGVLRFRNLTAQSGADRMVANGDMSLNASASGGYDESIALSTANFAVASTFGGVQSNQTLTNYDTSLQVRNATWTTAARGTLTSSALNSGSVAIETPTPFARPANQSYPAIGQAVMSGAAGSRVRVTALNAATVKIELDADGGGVYEAAVDKPWSDIL